MLDGCTHGKANNLYMKSDEILLMSHVEPALIMIHLVKGSCQVSHGSKYLLNIKLDFACNNIL